MTESLSQCILSQVPMGQDRLVKILDAFEPISLKKGDFFLKPGSICRRMAYIESGYLRMFDIVNGKEITFWIGSAGRFITSLSSFVFQSENHWNIQAITDCQLHVIGRAKHEALCQSEPKWLEFDNLLLARSFALLEQSWLAQLHTTAQERFEDLMENQPDIFQNVPLQYIASMIGIAPESLSRLRKNLTDTTS